MARNSNEPQQDAAAEDLSNAYILAEPRGITYGRLLKLAGATCRSFSLVWADQRKFHPSAHAVATALQAQLLLEERTNEWPGTMLCRHLATVRHYWVDNDAMEVLEQAGGLYAWSAPDRPEDMAFYSADGAAWLGCISHERAWFVPSRDAQAEIQRVLTAGTA